MQPVNRDSVYRTIHRVRIDGDGVPRALPVRSNSLSEPISHIHLRMSESVTITTPDFERDIRAREVARRRTFAIISHPDAGKTTLTEKLLLYSGAIELAGAVRGSKTRRHATSDWMEMEQQRGISISAAALEFEMDGHRVTAGPAC